MVEGAGPGAQQVFMCIPRFTVSLNSSCFFYKTELVVNSTKLTGLLRQLRESPCLSGSRWDWMLMGLTAAGC